MKNYDIYKTAGCYTSAELRAMLNDYLEDEEMESLSDYALSERAVEMLINNYEDDFGVLGNVAHCAELMQYPAIISGSLGLWDGRHVIEDKVTENLLEAIEKCCRDCDDFKIFESAQGQLYVYAYHHDGTNAFKIQFKTPKGNRAVHLRKVLYN